MLLVECSRNHDSPYHSTAPGAILIEWNVHEPVGQQGTAGLWDTHVRYAFPIKSMNTAHHTILRLGGGRWYMAPVQSIS